MIVNQVVDFVHLHPVAVGVVAAGAALVLLKRAFSSGPKGRNPFSKDGRKPMQPFVADHAARDKVLKQGFTMDKVPAHVDAIVVGSGIGGLASAAILARAGKRVLVLEQHDQAGGCCHTFLDKGYEFDTGIHYIGETGNRTLFKQLLDQISEGQIEWTPLEDEYDRVLIGEPGKARKIPIVKGKDNFRAALLKEFPNEAKAIDGYLDLLAKSRRSMGGFVSLKFLPVWIAKLLVKTGLLGQYTDYFKYAGRSVSDVFASLTDDLDLRATLAYCWGDYGTPPHKAPFTMHAALVNHFLMGVAYPRGGASEIAYHIIPVIESAGGRVLVRATVTEIIVEGSTAVGVKVRKGAGSEQTLHAPLIISDAGVFNTFERLVPSSAALRVPTDSEHIQHSTHGVGAMSVYIGLEGDADELNLKATNAWAFTSNSLDSEYDRYISLPASKAGTEDIPLLFVSFPSCKDPTWKQRFPGKSTCEIVTLAPYEWFEQWESARVMKRGEEYTELKERIGRRAWEQVCAEYPQLKGREAYFDVASPVTNKWYLMAPRGEIYGIDHTLARFSPEAVIALRPETPIKNLLLTGQDVFSCGFAGAMFGGLLTASRVLNRNLMLDLAQLHSQIKKKQ